MELIRTVPIILQADDDVLRTVQRFRSVQQAVSQLAFESLDRRGGGERQPEPPSAIALHHTCYAALKGQISAQLTATAIRLVAGAYRSAWRKGHSLKRRFDFRRPLAVWLIGERGRDASFPADGTLSLWTVAGRKRLPFSVPPHFRGQLDRATRVNSLTVIAAPGTDGGGEGHGTEGRAAGNGARLRGWLTVTVEAPDPVGHSPVGIDLGVLNAMVAVDVDDRVLFLSGSEHQARSERTRRVRQRVQQKKAAHKARKKDTHSLRRLLKRLSRKQQNRTRTFAQQAAKSLCAWAPTGAVLALEELRLPAGQPVRRDQTRGRLTGWFHGLLRRCIECKAAEFGIRVASIHPAFTSRDCSRCGQRGRRRGHRFACPHCGHAEHADVNAARNIRDAGGAVLHAVPDARRRA